MDLFDNIEEKVEAGTETNEVTTAPREVSTETTKTLNEPLELATREPKKTTKELWIELGRLILLLLWAITKKIIRVTYKSIRFACQVVKQGWAATVEWWNDKSTQEKVRSIRRKTKVYLRASWKGICTAARFLWKWTKLGCRKFIKYTIVALIMLWKGLVWLCVNFVQLIIHMKPTLKRMGKAMKSGWKSMQVRMAKAKRGRRLKKIKRRRRYEAFKRNGGVKGALERTSSSLKSSIQSYMEEEQDETTPEAITEDDIIGERFQALEQDNRAQVIGKKFFSSIKNIVEEE